MQMYFKPLLKYSQYLVNMEKRVEFVMIKTLTQSISCSFKGLLDMLTKEEMGPAATKILKHVTMQNIASSLINTKISFI